MKHRATGNPRGRPISVGANIGARIIAALERRVDPETGLATPDWRGLIAELGVSRATLARHLAILHHLGTIESVNISRSADQVDTYYKLNK